MIQVATAREHEMYLPLMGKTESTSPFAVVAPISGAGKETLVIGRQDLAQDIQVVHFSPSSQAAILEENQTLRETVQVLQSQMANILSALGLDRPEPRDITKAQAKREIEAHFRKSSGQTIYPSDVADELGLSYELVVGIIEQLEGQRRIAKAE